MSVWPVPPPPARGQAAELLVLADADRQQRQPAELHVGMGASGLCSWNDIVFASAADARLNWIYKMSQSGGRARQKKQTMLPVWYGGCYIGKCNR